MTKNQMLALKAAAILWVVWGLVHMFAGVMTITQDTAGSVAGIADAVDPALLAGDYHPAVGAVLNQHGFNLLWIGTYTLIAAIFIWRANLTAIWTAAIVGGVTDVGYFIFMDLGGYVNFFPGTVMTLVSASAILLSVPLWWINRSKAAG